jgi:hypothetical protein
MHVALTLRRLLTAGPILALGLHATAQDKPQEPGASVTILRPARVFDGEAMHDGWAARVAGTRIEAVGPAASVVSTNAQVVDLALQAGFTTLRDLGTEGAGYADVGLKQAVDEGIIPGPQIRQR